MAEHTSVTFGGVSTIQSQVEGARMSLLTRFIVVCGTIAILIGWVKSGTETAPPASICKRAPCYQITDIPPHDMANGNHVEGSSAGVYSDAKIIDGKPWNAPHDEAGVEFANDAANASPMATSPRIVSNGLVATPISEPTSSNKPKSKMSHQANSNDTATAFRSNQIQAKQNSDSVQLAQFQLTKPNNDASTTTTPAPSQKPLLTATAEKQSAPNSLTLLAPEPNVVSEVIQFEQPADDAAAADDELPPPEAINNEPTVDDQNPRRQLLLQAAQNSVALKELEEAASRFELLLDEFPNDVEGRIQYAGILAQLGENEKAIQNYRRVLQVEQGHSEATAGLADLLIRQGNLDEAAGILSAQLEQRPSDKAIALRLTQIYLQANNRALAAQMLAKHLLPFELTAEERATVAGIRLDLNDPGGAIQLLKPMLENNQLSKNGLKLALRCYAMLGDWESLRGLVSQKTQSDPSNSTVAIELASELLDEENSGAAYHILEEVIRYVPPDSDLVVLLARARIAEFQFVFAQQTLEEFCGLIPEWERTLLLGEIMLASGNYLEALSDFEQTLDTDPGNRRANFGKARALQELGQFDAAECVLANYVLTHPNELSAKYRLAQLYVDRRIFISAERLYIEIIESNPGVVYTYEAYIRLLAKQYRFEEAQALIAELQASRPMELLLISQLRIELAGVLMKERRPIEAMELLRNYKPVSRLQIPRGYFLMHVAASRAGDNSVALGAKQKLLMICSESLATSVQTAELALSECLAKLAVEILQQAKSACGDQIAMIVREADAHAAMQNQESFFVAEEIYRSALATSPTNARARIGLARVLISMGRAAESERLYNGIASDMPNYVVALREKARLVYQLRGNKYGAAAYNTALRQAEPSGQMFAPPAQIGPALSIDRTHFDSPTLTQAISAEKQAKSFKDWRPTTAIHEYQNLIAIEPTNEDAYFDLAQQYSMKKRTCAALGVYNELLEVNPCNYAASVAVTGTRRKLKPRTDFNFLYFRQSGRDGLANVTRLGMEWGAAAPFGDEDEYVRFNYKHLIYRAPGFSAVSGNSFGGEIHDRFLEDYTWFAKMDVQVFDDGGFSNRPVFDVGFGKDIIDDAYVEVGGFFENVVENGESIRQDLSMGGGRLLGRMNVLPRWAAESRYRFIGYSDNNFRHDFYVHNRFRVLQAPNEVNLLADYDFLSFREQSTPGAGPGIQGTTHPYFAPSGFSTVSLGAEWKYHFGQHHFDGAPQKWCSVEYRGQWDSSGEFYNNASVKAYCDVSERFAAGAETMLTRSAVYDNDMVYAYMIYWLP